MQIQLIKPHHGVSFPWAVVSSRNSLLLPKTGMLVTNP
jgi:hypothetical protein